MSEDTTINIRINRKEKRKFVRAIKSLGYKTISEYFRMLIRSVAGLDKKE
jgi:antitoxin component of RelBE/YafQ-DinJ toxin-antitoxin module